MAADSEDRPPDGPATPPRRFRAAPVLLSVSAAAAAVVAVVTGARLLTDDPADDAPAAAKPRHETRQPRFSLQAGADPKEPWLKVEAVRRGGPQRPVDTVRAPASAGPARAIVEAPHGAFLVLAPTAKPCQTRLYRFRLTGNGHVTGLRSAGSVPDLAAGLAVSPDGARVAYTSAPCADGSQALRIRPAAPNLSVLDTATGRRRTWTTTGTAAVGEIVWADDGRTLGYTFGDIAGGILGQVTVHALDTTAGGTDLRAGRVLFRQTGDVGTVASAVMSPDGESGHGTGKRGRPPTTVLFSFKEGRTKIGSTIPPKNGRGVGVLVSTGDGPRHACLNGVDAFDRTMSGGFGAPARFPATCSIAWAY